MRIVSADAEMRNQYYYTEFRQEQERRRIQLTATPPLQRTESIKPQKDRRKKSPSITRLSGRDELTIQLINALLEDLLGLPSVVMSLTELNKLLNQQLTLQTDNAQMWLHIAETLQDMLLPAHYPLQHFNKNSISLSPQLEIEYATNTSYRLDSKIKLSSTWMQMLLQLDISSCIEKLPQLVHVRSTTQEPEQDPVSLHLDVNLEDVQIKRLSSPVVDGTDVYKPEYPAFLNHLRIWSEEKNNRYKLLAIGIEDFGVIYLGHNNDNLVLQQANHQYDDNGIYNLQQIDFIV